MTTRKHLALEFRWTDIRVYQRMIKDADVVGMRFLMDFRPLDFVMNHIRSRVKRGLPL
jgi:hypothetical protein